MRSWSTRHVECEPLGGNRFELGESARWDGSSLWLVNIPYGDVWRGDFAANALEHVIHLDVPVGAVNPARDEGLVLAAGNGIALLDASHGLSWLAEPTAGLLPPRRMNDAGVDRAGRLWCGSMDDAGTRDNGAIYRVTGAKDVTKVVDGLGCPNGPVFSGDGRWMYLADTLNSVILRYPVDTRGELGSASLFAKLPDSAGWPDGMTTDAEDHLWVALWGGSAILRLDPEDGEVSDAIAVPARHPTSVCIAGNRLVVTTARTGVRRPGALDGAVLILEAPVTGRSAAVFGTPSDGPSHPR